jgi:hypothetical protein
MQKRKRQHVKPHGSKLDVRHEKRARPCQAVHRVSAQASGLGIDTFQVLWGDGGCIAPKRQDAGQRMLYLSSRGMFGSGLKKRLPGKGTSTKDCGAAKTRTVERARTEEVTG